MTSKDHPNSLLILQCWQAAANGDPETLRAIFSENIVWHVTASVPWQGDHVGHDEVLEYLAEVGDSAEPHKVTLRNVLANDEYGSVLFHIESERGNRSLAVDQILFGRFESHQIAEIWTLALDPSAIEQFWSQSD